MGTWREDGFTDAERASSWPLSRHRLDEVGLGKLCSTGEQASVARVLLDAEYSRRLLLLRAVVDELGSLPEASGPLEPVKDAWDLLARAQRRDPETVRRLLMDPQTGLWAAHLLRRLRGSADDDAPLWTEVGHLHALAAAGGTLAGLGFRIRVPARGGAVLLPSLGRAGTPRDGRRPAAGEPEQWGVAEVNARDGAARVALAPGQVVDVPAEPACDALDWWGTRRICSTYDGVTLSLSVDDLGLYPVIPGDARPVRLDRAAADRWQQRLDRAWALLVTNHRESAEALAEGLLSLVPLPRGQRFRPRSASASEAFGCVMVSEPHAGPDTHEATVELAVTLVHEFRHTLLNGLLHLTPLTEECADLFHAPWRDDPRPLMGLLHGAFAFSGVTRFWRARCAHDTGRALALAQFEFALWRRQSRTALRTLDAHPALTATGHTLVRGLMADLQEWETDPVPRRALYLAERAAAHQRAAWRAHHLVPEPAAVAAVAGAWLSGQAPPYPAAVEPGFELRTDPAGCRLDVYAHLVRLMTMDPESFAEVRRAGTRAAAWAPGVTAADLAYVADDDEEAVLLYSREAAGGGRAAAWGALGLLLVDRHADQVSDDDRHAMPPGRPGLLRAVFDEVVRGSERPVSPIVLADWLVHGRHDLSGTSDFAASRSDSSRFGTYSGSGSMSQSARCSQSTA
ncbi:HEXXH motif domain-containing protein [Streptomyces sp. NPDC057837]|uniref:HEXXH motif domain-containing protein n=1 Tax=unclassified Streptomyces TaxID=2593676 RepID=UPI003677FD64